MGNSSKNRGSGGLSNFLAWLVVLASLGLLGWLWWHSALIPKPAPPAPGKVASLPSTNRVTEPQRAPDQTVPAPSPTAPVVRTNQALPQPPPSLPEGSRFVQNVFEAQVALARMGISSGCIDGSLGSQTRAALRAFQARERLAITGDLDVPTKSRLFLNAPPYTYYTVTSNDLARLTPVPSTWLGKSEQERLDYETIAELVAEKGEAHIGFIRSINPSVDWTNIVPGVAIKMPNVQREPLRAKAAWLTISLSGKTIEAFDSRSNLVAHAPCSIAQRVEKRPVGQLFVAKIAINPNYSFDPEIFPESAEARKIKRKIMIPPGPNNPVGTAWIGLDKPGYGIHGTPKPEQVGRTESHGCFRLANWNADYFVKLAWTGLPVIVEH